MGIPAAFHNLQCVATLSAKMADRLGQGALLLRGGARRGAIADYAAFVQNNAAFGMRWIECQMHCNIPIGILRWWLAKIVLLDLYGIHRGGNYLARIFVNMRPIVLSRFGLNGGKAGLITGDLGLFDLTVLIKLEKDEGALCSGTAIA